MFSGCIINLCFKVPGCFLTQRILCVRTTAPKKRFYLVLFNCVFNVITHRKSNLKSNFIAFILTTQQDNLRISKRK